ncbi:hypothetical protein [Paenibacillus lacisoli]|nr:hypothetical protein [Paenibacillus sp. JX-17]
MSNSGQPEDYAGPYSPYSSVDTSELHSVHPGGCPHLFTCPHCHHDEVYVVPVLIAQESLTETPSGLHGQAGTL